MSATLVWSHPQSSHGAVLFPTHVRTVNGKLYVRSGDDFYQTLNGQNSAYPINYEVTTAHPEYKAVAEAFGFVPSNTGYDRRVRRAA